MSQLSADNLTVDTIIPFIVQVFRDHGDEAYLGEPVTMSQHMLQGATIAMDNGLDDEIVAAVLLHDIGHFVGNRGTFSMSDTEDREHEASGADLLAPFFPRTVINCVRWHVAAKRYLCATRPAYFKRLSAASIHSLELQGGPMDTDEVREFEKNPDLNAIIQVRHLDEAGKKEEMETRPLADFIPTLERLVTRQGD